MTQVLQVARGFSGVLVLAIVLIAAVTAVLGVAGEANAKLEITVSATKVKKQ